MKHLRLLQIALVIGAAWIAAACGPKPPEVRTATPTAIRTKIKQSKAPLTLVHVWATWCQPCREEFPELMLVEQTYREKGVAFLLVSADNPETPQTVETFLNEQNSRIGSLISTELNQSFIEMLSPNWTGALPATFFYDAQGRLLHEWEGTRSRAHYENSIQRFLDKEQGGNP